MHRSLAPVASDLLLRPERLSNGGRPCSHMRTNTEKLPTSLGSKRSSSLSWESTSSGAVYAELCLQALPGRCSALLVDLLCQRR